MPLGPIFARELIVAARKAVTFRSRAWIGVLILLILFGNDWIWKELSQGDLSPRGVRAFCRSLFGAFAALQVIATFALVPALLGPTIAGEKTRKTLHYLLASRLTAREIILGKVGSKLAMYGMALLVGLPFQWGLCELGGIDWRWTLLAYGGTLALAVFLAGATILISTWARDSREVTQISGGLFTLWLLGPLVVERWLAPLLSPWTSWVGWINHALFWPCSPMRLVFGLPGYLAGRLANLSGDLLEMMAYLAAYGLLFLTLAIVLLRPIYRRQADGDGGFRRVRIRKARRRPPVGEDALFWRERHLTKRPRGLALAITVVLSLAMLGGLGYTTYRFADPCFRPPPGGLSAGEYQDQFSTFLRIISISMTFVVGMIAASGAAVSITAEREGDTWDALIATPLDGREILRAKVLGDLWRIRFVPVIVLALWGVGVAAGAVHPWGLALAALGLAIACGFAAVLGVVLSLVAKDSSKASGWSGIAQLVPMILVPMLLYMPSLWTPLWLRPAPWMATTCLPAVVASLLLRPSEVRNGLNPENLALWFGGGSASVTSRTEILLCGAIGLAIYAVAAVALIRWASSRFDRLVGRPCGRGTPPEGRAEDRIVERAGGRVEALARS